MRRRISTAGSERGFTYLVLLIAIFIIGIMAEAAVFVTSTSKKIEKESELLFRGQAFSRAIESYYDASVGEKEYPRSLDDLLMDPRFPMKRHIRKLYNDPMSGKFDWRLIRTSDGGIAGVASRSMEAPLKRSGFPKGLESFEGAESYSMWIFEFKARPGG